MTDDSLQSVVPEEIRKICHDFSEPFVAGRTKIKEGAKSISWSTKTAPNCRELRSTLSYLAWEYSRLTAIERQFADKYLNASEDGLTGKSHFKALFAEADDLLVQVTKALGLAIHYARGHELIDDSLDQNIKELTEKNDGLTKQIAELQQKLNACETERDACVIERDGLRALRDGQTRSQIGDVEPRN